MTDAGSGVPAGGMRWALARTLEIRRREGAAGLIFRLLAAVGYRRNDWFVRPLAEPIQPVQAEAPVELRELTAADVEDYLAFRRGATRGSFLGRLEEGCRCYAARWENRIVSVSWTSTGQGYIDFLERTFPLASDEVYLFDSFTSREHRGRRLQAVICAHILAQFRDQGYRDAISLIRPENTPNIKSRTRSGFRRTGTMGRIKIGGWTRHFFRGRRSIDTSTRR